ncbi:unnamed protein product [Phytophthora fragariaefolia]|uniref:Unnamed protein product n=1 Tax=Phytophthora fragariaefolia TaxID=1490495 RepID=A0A9W7CVC1_9STRA|nr:unnamed protein product [Phytophthora fragariaefolia]
MQKDAAHESLKREYESRSGLEQLLRSYKDEIVTLKEALQIAAQAVAEATMPESSAANPNVSGVDAAVGVTSGQGYQYDEYAYSSYPPDTRYWEEGSTYAHGGEAAVHPAEVAAAEGWTGEDSIYQVQDAVAVHPAELRELEEVGGIHQETDAQVEVHPVEVQAGLEHGQESEREEFEDAVDE